MFFYFIFFSTWLIQLHPREQFHIFPRLPFDIKVSITREKIQKYHKLTYQRIWLIHTEPEMRRHAVCLALTTGLPVIPVITNSSSLKLRQNTSAWIGCKGANVSHFMSNISALSRFFMLKNCWTNHTCFAGKGNLNSQRTRNHTSKTNYNASFQESLFPETVFNPYCRALSIVAYPYKEQVLIESRLLFCWFH